MNPNQALSLFRWSLKHRGLAETVKTSLRRLSSRNQTQQHTGIHPFDLEFGLDTGGLISGGRLAVGSKNDSYNSAYYGIAPSRFRAGIQRWKASVPPDTLSSYSFIDIGSGKGRAVMLASEQPFRQVIGVDINPGLADTAAQNLKKWQHLGHSRCPVYLLTQDAAAFTFPDGPCALYMYNPFAAHVVKQIIQNIERQFEHRSGQLDVLYFKPVAAALFDAHPRFTLLWSGILPLSQEDSEIDQVSSANDICNIYRW
jgi:SAM-dependent methyltransferase